MGNFINTKSLKKWGTIICIEIKKWIRLINLEIM